MLNYNDVQTDPLFEHEYMNGYISLNKLLKVPIKDILVRIGSEYEDTDIMIQYIVLEDNSTLGLQGEHDLVYLETYREKHLPLGEELQNIYDTDPDRKHDE